MILSDKNTGKQSLWKKFGTEQRGGEMIILAATLKCLGICSSTVVSGRALTWHHYGPAIAIINKLTIIFASCFLTAVV